MAVVVQNLLHVVKVQASFSTVYASCQNNAQSIAVKNEQAPSSKFGQQRWRVYTCIEKDALSNRPTVVAPDAPTKCGRATFMVLP